MSTHSSEPAPLIVVDVPIHGHPHQVLVGEGILGSLGERLRPLGLGTRCALVTDSNVGPLYGDACAASLEEAGFDPHRIEAPAGEASKSVPVAESICREMMRAGLDRKSFLIALGGGVVGDLAGFAAAIFYRGIPYIQVPTSVVAQVDSSVGGKTGVNTPEGKNLIGAFHQPRLVLADVATLQSLPEREFNEGFAEIIKHAVIRDRGLLDLVDTVADRNNLAPLIERNVAIKAKVVVEDEKETSGVRALLNFGHTIGHAIEAAAGYGELLHGEAISLGMLAAARISMEIAGLPKDGFERIHASLKRFGLPLTLPPRLETPALMDLLARDKKFVDGSIRFVVSSALGSAEVSEEVDATRIEAAIESLRG